jgi:hypothetical protein
MLSLSMSYFKQKKTPAKMCVAFWRAWHQLLPRKAKANESKEEYAPHVGKFNARRAAAPKDAD